MSAASSDGSRALSGGVAIAVLVDWTALSGRPQAAVGAAFIGVAAGDGNLISIDSGGTSADIGVIHDGAPGLTDNGYIGDWPLALGDYRPDDEAPAAAR